MEQMIVRSLEIPARDWRLQLAEELVAVPSDGEPIRIARGDLAQVEIITISRTQSTLVLHTPHRKKLQLRMTSYQRGLVEAWLGPPTWEQLRVALRRRHKFLAPLGALFVLFSSPLPGDPEQGLPAHPFDLVSALLGVSLLLLWYTARYRPAPLVFLTSSVWFALLMLSTLWDIYLGVSSPTWFLLIIPCGWLSYSGVTEFKRFRQLSGGVQQSIT